VSTNLVELCGITKRYPGVTALDGVDFDVRPGEIHALAGENGAGKSTLMKILGGAVAPDAGEIRFGGETVTMRSPRDALTLGISTVHQELVAAHSLDVTENILLGRLPRRMGRVLWAPARQQARQVLDRLGVDLDERTRMDRLSLGQQQLVEIARALVRETRLLVLDEPSAILGQRELEVLYRVLHQLREQGTGIVYISHRLSEVLALSDRVTVLKDGRRQQSVPVTELDEERLVTLMTGRQLVTPPKTPPPEDALVLLSVRTLRVATSSSPVDLEIRAGEIVGLAGLVGSGRTEVARAIIGADPATGTVSVAGRRLTRRSPRSCRRAGLGYLPEDRKDSGLLMNRSIRENIGLASLGTRSRWGLLRGGVDRTDVARRARDVRLKAPDLDAATATLSGGNQQKVMLARWLAANPQVLILDEPTRGIDVGGKSEIYRLMRELTQAGQAVLMISSEIEEVLAMSDRVLVMRGGAMVAELRGEQITEQAVTRAAIVGPSGDAQSIPAAEAGSDRVSPTITEVVR
jgi:ABC-type sugar transport system ATPase subunit